MKPSQLFLALYLLLLLGIVLLKFPFHVSLMSGDQTGLNLMPFAGSQTQIREMFDNFVIFIPFGLLLSVNFKQMNLWGKVALICSFSLSVEVIQFVFAIGVADITDVITNTSGGLLGLALYGAGNAYVDHEKLDRFIVVAGLALLVASAVPLGILFSHSERHHLRWQSAPGLQSGIPPEERGRY